MTSYSTETEAESHQAAELAQIALEAAIEAVENHQRRTGRCDAPFRVTLHVDNGNEADREGSFPPITTEDEAREIGRDALRRAGEAHDRYTGRDGWILHDGSDSCPVHSMDVVELWQKPLGGRQHLANKPGNPASMYGWSPITHYRPLRDSDGVLYCSAEGLESWAEYVATDESGSVWQYSYMPVQYDHHWDEGDTNDRRGIEDFAPDRFSNTRTHWTNTLRRVYRREDA